MKIGSGPMQTLPLLFQNHECPVLQYKRTCTQVCSKTFVKLTLSACAGVTVLCGVSSLSDLYEPVSDIMVACKINVSKNDY